MVGEDESTPGPTGPWLLRRQCLRRVAVVTVAGVAGLLGRLVHDSGLCRAICKPSDRGSLHQKFRPENMIRPGSYFCRVAASCERLAPKYRDAGWFASR